MSEWTWEDVPGFFDFADIYDQMVSEAVDGDSFVEVGTYLGKSAIYMVDAIRRSGKLIRFHCVDRWDGTGWDGLAKAENSIPALGNEQASLSLWDAFQYSLRKCDVRSDEIHCIRGLSDVSAGQFADRSVKFAFIDADHRYPAILADIRAWLPKISPGGCLGGHDYVSWWSGVIQAVDELLPQREVRGNSWLIQP